MLRLRPAPALNAKTGGSSPRGAAGFSLLELIIVLFIIGVVGSRIGMGLYRNTLMNQQLEAATRRVQADLELTRRRAGFTSAAQSVVFNPGTGVYSVPGMPALDQAGTNQTYTVDLAKAPYEVSIVSAQLGDDASIIFDAFGRPDSGGTIVIGSADRQKTITVDADSGRTSVQ